MDLNHDGYLTPDEIDVMSAKAYQRRAKMQGAPGEGLQAPRRSAMALNPVTGRPGASARWMMVVGGFVAAPLLLATIIVLGLILDRRRGGR